MKLNTDKNNITIKMFVVIRIRPKKCHLLKQTIFFKKNRRVHNFCLIHFYNSFPFFKKRNFYETTHDIKFHPRL